MLSIITGIILTVIFVAALLLILVQLLLYRTFHHRHVVSTTDPEHYNLNARELFLTTAGTKKIQTLLINETAAGPLVLAVHGWENAADIFYPVASNLSRSDVKFLLVNTRNHGRSDADSYSTMVKYAQDVETALNYAREYLAGEAGIYLMGHSLGGATGIYIGTKNPDLRGIISIASFADLKQILDQGFLSHRFPKWAIRPILRYLEMRVGEKIRNLSPIENIKKLTMPVLVVHGTEDHVIRSDNADLLLEAAPPGQVRLALMEGEDHSSLLSNDRFFDLVATFIGDFRQVIRETA